MQLVVASAALIQAVDRSDRPRCAFALAAGFNASWLSMILNQRLLVDMEDPRLAKLAELVGLPFSTCFSRVTFPPLVDDDGSREAAHV